MRRLRDRMISSAFGCLVFLPLARHLFGGEVGCWIRFGGAMNKDVWKKSKIKISVLLLNIILCSMC